MASSKLTRREFIPAAAALVGAAGGGEVAAAAELPRELAAAAARMEPYLFPQSRFQDVSRGNPIPHRLSEERRREVGLTRESWQLEVIPDSANPATLARPLTRTQGTAFNFDALMKLAEKHAVRFPKVMTCLNIGCPLGMGIWEGVPLREVLWLTQPKENLRRVFYYGYHNDDPKQMFRSSLPISRVFEDPFDLPPVILCYKLNGEWLEPQRGGPVRVVVPEAYGFKNIKWLSHVVLTNLFYANDTYGEQNNDVDSPLKTFAGLLDVPASAKAGTSIPITGWAQCGLGGLSRVQTWVRPVNQPWPDEDPTFIGAPWVDAHVLSPPTSWGVDLPGGRIPPGTHGFHDSGAPKQWPMRLTKAQWAALLPPLPPGEYTIYCRAIDEKGHAQPMPRPFRKSGHAAIQFTRLVVTA